jgi:hypothetical protein
MGAPNFTLLDSSLPEIGRLISAMLQARAAVERRSWSHPQEPTSEDWWADVLADPRGRKRERSTDLAVKQAFYRLADEKREIILVGGEPRLRAMNSSPLMVPTVRCPTCSTISPHRIAVGSTLNGIAAACNVLSPSRAHASFIGWHGRDSRRWLVSPLGLAPRSKTALWYASKPRHRSRNVAMSNATVTPAIADQTMWAKVSPRTYSTVPTVPSAPNISHRNAKRHEAR